MAVERLYLDYNATSPLSQSVIDWLKSGDFLFANPSSQHSDGKASRRSVNEARELIFKTFNKSDKETKLFFHSGATEGILTISFSLAEEARLNGKDLLICFSKIDHPAVTSLEEKFFGPHVKFLELKRDENLHYLHHENFQAIKDKKDNNPDLLILYHHLWVHNETGQISSLQELKDFKNIPDLFIHVDGVQAPGKIENWKELIAGDAWTYSGHKFGSLKGIGFTLLDKSFPFHPLLIGGSQQENLRSGTENIHGVKSLALALRDISKVDVKKNKLSRDKLLKFIQLELKGIGEVLDDDTSASNTIYFYLHNLASDITLALFDVHGIEISAGSACSSGASKSSEVLLRRGLDKYAKNGLRLSMAFQNNEDDLNQIIARLKPVFNKLREV